MTYKTVSLNDKAYKLLKKAKKERDKTIDYTVNNFKPKGEVKNSQLKEWVKDFYATGRAAREDFINSLERTATMVNERTSILKLEFEKNSLKLSANTPDLGDSFDKMSIKFDNEDLKIAFNYKYILDCLKVIESEDVIIEMNGSLSAALIKPHNDEEYLCLIMPVQIK